MPAIAAHVTYSFGDVAASSVPSSLMMCAPYRTRQAFRRQAVARSTTALKKLSGVGECHG